MADGINLPQGLYTAGAVPLNLEPATNTVMQLALKKQAHDEALNEYFQNQNRVNSDGLREQDIPQFMQKYNDFQGFYSQNRRAIQNPTLDNGAAQSEWNARHNDMMTLINQSKERSAVAQKLAQYRANPTTAYMFSNPDIIPGIHANDLPVGAPGSQILNLDQVQTNSAPLSLKDQHQIQTSLLYGLKPNKIINSTKQTDGSIMDTYGFNDDDKRTIGNRATMLYRSDPRIRAYANSSLMNPLYLNTLNPAFRQVFGRDIETPEDAFAADQLINSGSNTTSNKRAIDYAARSQMRLSNDKIMERIRQGDRMALMQAGVDYRKASAEDQTAINEGLVDLDLQEAQSQRGKTVIGQDGNVEYVSPGNAVIRQALSNGDYSHKRIPDEIRYNSDGTEVRGVFYKLDRHGNRIPDGSGGYVEEQGRPGWSTVESLKPLVGNQIKSLHQAPPPVSSKSYNINGKTYTHSQLLGMGYTEQQIQQAIQNGNIK